MIMNKLTTRLGSVLVAVLLVLLPAQLLLASVILNVQPGPGGKPTARSFIKDTVIGERLEAGPNEILEVLLSDGTSLTLGPGSALVVESFTYDPKSQSGQLSVRLEQGRFRVVGGLLNNTGNIAVQTPSGNLDLDNAAVFVEVRADGTTRASLLHGKSLKMTTNGKSETVERPAFEVVSAGANQPLKSPSRQDPKMVTADVLALNSQSLLGQEGGGGVGDPGGQGTLVLTSLSATGSETPFSSGSVSPAGNPGTGETPPTSPPPTSPPPESPPPTSPPPTSPPPTSPPPISPPTSLPSVPRPDPIDVALNPSGGFGPGAAIEPPNTSTEGVSQSNNDRRSLAQARENAVLADDPQTIETEISEPIRDKGRTTNRLVNSNLSDPFTQVWSPNDQNPQKPIPVADGNSTNLQYVFSTESNLSLVIDGVADLGPNSHVLQGELGGSYDVKAPFYLTDIKLPQQPNQIFERNISSIFLDVNRGEGSIFVDGTHFKILQAGFFNEEVKTLDEAMNEVIVDVVRRKPDNFLLVEVRPAKVDRRERDNLRAGNFDFNTDAGRQAFLFAIDPTSSLDGLFLSSQQINSLAAVILNPTVKPGAPLTDEDLKALDFLSADDDDSARRRLAIRSSVNVGLEFSPPDSTARYVFATGNVDGRLQPTFKKEFSVDQFFISAGLENFDLGKTVADGIRAFSRKETGLGLNLAADTGADTGLLVVNPGSASSTKQSTLLHADFGLQGTRSEQQSTISVTIGNIDYQTDPPSKSVEVIVEGRTIGSSHGTIKQVNQNGPPTEVKGATVGFSSPLRSTAAGGGNPSLKEPDGTTTRQGYAGYFVFENYDPAKDPQDPNSKTENGDTPLLGGTEKPLGGSGDQNYAYLRLATATGSSKPTLRSELTLNGWMGGLAEFENGSSIGLTQIDSGDTPDNITIQTSPANNTVEAKFNLFGQNPNQATTFNLGGLSVDGTSAFVDDNRFAARSSNSNYEVAMVSADLFRDGNNGNLPAALNRPDGTSIPQYEHLKWGFFFGDTKTTTGAREHVHLGTWIAGKIPTGDSLGLRGAATYSGHSIGNVFNNGSLYTAVGSFQNQWDFDKRTGTVNMSFDQTAYTGTTAIKGSTFNFNGNLSAPGRQGGLQGSFVAPVNPTPAAVMGNFAIAETPGNATYRAAGTFGAERK